MMPPRLQCLNVVKTVSRVGSSRAAFSSTPSQPYADPPTSNASSLASIGNDAFSNPIKLPKRERGPQSFQTPRNAQGTERMRELIQRASENTNRHRAAAQTSTPLSTAEELSRFSKAAALSKQIARRWKAGDVYAPHDLSPVEMEKWKKRGRPGMDALDVLDLNPLDEYKNFSIMSEYMTPMGRIEHSSNTGLRPVNQRRMAKAIRRAVGLGLMPSVHRHPEILRKELLRRNDQMNRLTRGP